MKLSKAYEYMLWIETHQKLSLFMHMCILLENMSKVCSVWRPVINFLIDTEAMYLKVLKVQKEKCCEGQLT